MRYNTLKFDWVEHPRGSGKILQKEYVKTENKPKERFIHGGYMKFFKK